MSGSLGLKCIHLLYLGRPLHLYGVWCRVYGDAAGSIDALQFDAELGLLSEVEFHMFLPCLFFWFLHFPPKNIT